LLSIMVVLLPLAAIWAARATHLAQQRWMLAPVTFCAQHSPPPQ
jgi:hypothetical protein